MRNLDLTALRSLVAVAETGGVTKAAGLLNLTQSAVSMQLKRLEDSLGVPLLDRNGRGVELTGTGELVMRDARRMLDINDGIVSKTRAHATLGEIVLGVPHDIVHPAIPRVLHAFNADYPRVRVNLVSSGTRRLKEQFARGECQIILTTEDMPAAEGETLNERELVWIGAEGGQVWRQRPLRLALESRCIFREPALAALDAAGIAWEIGIESDSSRTVEASVAADLAVHVGLLGTEFLGTEVIRHGGTLPELGASLINMYVAKLARNPQVDRLAELLRQSYRAI